MVSEGVDIVNNASHMEPILSCAGSGCVYTTVLNADVCA